MVKIRKATQKQTITAIKSGDFSTVDAVDAIAEQDAKKVFNAVSGGLVSLAWYDLPPVRCASGSVSFLRYVLTQSTKKDNCLQLTCIEVKNGVDIPTSDHEYSTNTPDGFRDFFRDLPNKATINFLEQ